MDCTRMIRDLHMEEGAAAGIGSIRTHNSGLMQIPQTTPVFQAEILLPVHQIQTSHPFLEADHDRFFFIFNEKRSLPGLPIHPVIQTGHKRETESIKRKQRCLIPHWFGCIPFYGLKVTFHLRHLLSTQQRKHQPILSAQFLHIFISPTAAIQALQTRFPHSGQISKLASASTAASFFCVSAETLSAAAICVLHHSRLQDEQIKAYRAYA